MLGVCLALIDDEEDKKAFERLVHKYERKLLAVSMNILKNETLAEHAVWDAFFNIAEHYNKINNLAVHKIEAYLIITIKNTSYAIYNKEKNHSKNKNIDDLLSEQIPCVDDMDKFDYDMLKNAIDKLDDKYRYVLSYMLVYGLSADETAKTMCISRRAVYKYLAKAKQLVIEMIGDKNE